MFLIFGAIVSPFLPDSPSTDTNSSGGGSSISSPAPTPEPTATEEVPNVKAKKHSALKVLNRLPVRGWASDSGYDREGKFGTAWKDVDGNGCDTRNDMLRRDFRSITRTDGCLIYKGVLRDVYTGKTIRFTRGTTTSLAVQIDHLVSLHNAWLTGAKRLSQSLRVALANDPLNLEAVDGPTNSSKSDDDASWWLPPRAGYRCTYVAKQISVKKAYHLWITPDEKIAMQSVLATCPRQKAYTTDYPARVKSGDLYVP